MDLKRNIDPVLLAELGKAFHPVLLVHLDWPGAEKIRVHSGIGQITWDGHIWTGVGSRGFVSLPQEVFGAGSFSGTLSLGGLPDDIDDYLTASVRGIDVDIYFGAVTERAGTALVGAPFAVFCGYGDDLGDEQSFAGEDSFRTITLAISSGPSQRADGGAFHTYGDQIASYPGDTAGRWVKAARAQSEAILPQW